MSPIPPNAAHNAYRPSTPQPPLVPPSRSESPGTMHLKALCRDPQAAMDTGLLPKLPNGVITMPPPTAAAARQFRESVLRADPTGHYRTHGEFTQSFRMEDGRVLPNAPLAYEMGSSVAAGHQPPGTFTNIHSHDYVPPPLNNAFPSPHDHLEARKAAANYGQAHELMYHPDSDRFFAYSGAVPPVFYEARFPGQGDPMPYLGPQIPLSHAEPQPPPAFLLPSAQPPGPILPPGFR